MPGRLAGLIRFVRLIFTPEHLDEVSREAPEPEAPADKPTDADAAPAEQRNFVGLLLTRETLPMDDPGDAALIKKAFVRTLLGREALGEDPPPDPTSRKPLFLRWIFTGPELGSETDAGDERVAPDTTGQE